MVDLPEHVTTLWNYDSYVIQIYFNAKLPAWRFIAYLKWKMKEGKCLVNDRISNSRLLRCSRHNGNMGNVSATFSRKRSEKNFSAFQKISPKTDLVLLACGFHLNVMINYGSVIVTASPPCVNMKSQKRTFFMTLVWRRCWRRCFAGKSHYFNELSGKWECGGRQQPTIRQYTVCAYFSSAWNLKRQKLSLSAPAPASSWSSYSRTHSAIMGTSYTQHSHRRMSENEPKRSVFRFEFRRGTRNNKEIMH